MTTTTPAFACNMSALSAAERLQHHQLAERLLGAAAPVELDDGYGFRLQAAALADVAAFVALERRCCPFFSFTIDLASATGAEDGPLWLRISGPPGVKPFIRAELAV
jgi:hypothetical protein